MARQHTYIGRLAPSPTGLLHLGHVRTFAKASERARSVGGRLRLRIDDLDPERCRPRFVQTAEDDLCWLGLQWDGEPWFQSRRGTAYLAGWRALVAGGWVYPCRCSRRELRAMAGAPHEGGMAPLITSEDEPLYPGRCRPAWLPGEQAGCGERDGWLHEGPDGRNWRFRVLDGESIAFHDESLGSQRFVAGRDFGDFAIWRRDGAPAYQLATVVDDAAMGVTEGVRGADLLLSTARQLLLFRVLGLPGPSWFHCPLVVDEAGERLAKRSDSFSIRALRERGLSPSEVLAMAGRAPVRPCPKPGKLSGDAAPGYWSCFLFSQWRSCCRPVGTPGPTKPPLRRFESDCRLTRRAWNGSGSITPTRKRHGR